jgi:hypothetical protein
MPIADNAPWALLKLRRRAEHAFESVTCANELVSEAPLGASSL